MTKMEQKQLRTLISKLKAKLNVAYAATDDDRKMITIL